MPAVEELRFVIKRQELEIKGLQQQLQKLTSDLEREEGKMTSQERSDVCKYFDFR